MSKQESLKKKIKKKFGSYSTFARLAGIDRYDLQANFLTKTRPEPEFMARIESLASSLDFKPKFDTLSPEQLESLREAINEFGGVIKFCSQYGYNKTTVFHILSDSYEQGRYKNKKLITPLVRRLLVHFKIVDK